MAKTVRIYEGKISIQFDYDPQLVEVIRGLPERATWVPRYRMWQMSVANYTSAVDSKLRSAGFEIAANISVVEKAAKRDRAPAAALADPDAPIPDLPSGRKLFAHQVDGVRWLLAHPFAILADDMGIGKTVQASVAARMSGLPVIVVCPAGLQLNWLREAEQAGASISVYSWGKVPEPSEMPDQFCLIADEAHYAQSMTAKRTKAFLALSDASGCRACWLLTGTPIKNGRPVNLYPLLKAIRHPLSEDRRGYEAYFCAARPTRFSPWDTSGASHLDELHDKISDSMLRRLKSECLDLPPKTRQKISADPSPKAMEQYKAAMQDARAKYTSGGNGDPLALLTAARKAASRAKIDTAAELIEELLEENRSAVVFVEYKDSAAELARRFGVGVYTGDTPLKERDRMVTAFQALEQRVFVSTIGAGGVGTTLTAAETVIMVDRPWTPGDADQAEDRLNRLGQRNHVMSYWLQFGPVDNSVDELLEKKAARIAQVLQGEVKTMRGTNISEKRIAEEMAPYLLKPNTRPDTHVELTDDEAF